MTRNDDDNRLIRSLGLRPADDACVQSGDSGETHDPALQRARQEHAALVRVYEAFDQNHDAYREQLLAALPADQALPPTELTGRRRRVGDFVMTYLLNRKTAAILTPAACLVIAAALFWAGNSQVAFARVIQKLSTFQTLVCRIHTEIAGGAMPANADGQIYISAQYGSRFDMLNNGELFSSIYSAPSGTSAVCVTPSMKTYMTVTHAGTPQGSPAAHGQWLASLQRLTGDADRLLGRELIDGRPAEGFEIAGEKLHRDGGGVSHAGPAMKSAVAKLWVDVDTLLPVRFEVTAPGPERGSTMTVVHDRFEWDRALDEAFFKPVIADDFTSLDLNIPAVNERTLIEGLRTFAELSGEYPRVLEPAYVTGQVAILIAKARAAAGDSGDMNDMMKGAAQKAVSIGSACGFYQQLDRDDRKPEYFGETVKPGDANSVLMTWLTDGGTRVILGDLSVEERSK